MATMDVKDATGSTVAVEKPNANGRAAAAASRPVALSTEDKAALDTLGGLTETAPASDTASSGLNGRLQRIAQRLTSLIALLPASLGSKAASASLAVTLSTEDRAQLPASLGSKAAASSLATTMSTEDLARFGSLTETAPASDTASSGLNGRLQRIAQNLTTMLAAVLTIGTRAYGAAATRVAYTGTSAQSAAITATEVMLHNCGTARCYVVAASNPTATVNDIPLEAGEKFTMRIASGHKIAVIQDSAGGNLNINPVA